MSTDELTIRQNELELLTKLYDAELSKRNSDELNVSLAKPLEDAAKSVSETTCLEITSLLTDDDLPQIDEKLKMWLIVVGRLVSTETVAVLWEADSRRVLSRKNMKEKAQITKTLVDCKIRFDFSAGWKGICWWEDFVTHLQTVHSYTSEILHEGGSAMVEHHSLPSETLLDDDSECLISQHQSSGTSLNIGSAISSRSPDYLEITEGAHSENSPHSSQDSEPNLDDDTEVLWRVLAFFEDKGFPVKLLRPYFSMTWNDEGEPLRQINELPLVFQSQIRCDAALKALEERGLISRRTDQFLDEYFIIENGIIDANNGEKATSVAAFMLVMYTFPKYLSLEPFRYTKDSKLLLPTFERVIPFLDDTSFCQMLSFNQVFAAVEACISASVFRDIHWKAMILSRTQQLLAPFDFMISMVRLRSSVLKRIESSFNPLELDLPRTYLRLDKRANALACQVALFEAQLLIDDSDHDGALHILNSVLPLEANNISPLEQIQIGEATIHRGRILRYKGMFHESLSCFQTFLNSPEKPRRMGKATTQLSSVMCEVGRAEDAVVFLKWELAELVRMNEDLHGRNATRLRIALAEAQLMAWMQNPQRSDHCVSALSLFHELHGQLSQTNLARVGRFNLFRASAGIAIIHQLSCNFDSGTCWWKNVESVAHQCGWETGHSDMIIALSRCELAVQQGSVLVAHYYLKEATEYYRFSGRQFQCTGLGTTWHDYLLGKISAALGTDQESLNCIESLRKPRSIIPQT